MALPRNLVYVFALTMVLAFTGMLYVIYTEQNLSNFIASSTNTVSRVSEKVHPVFEHFRRTLPDIDVVPRVTMANMSTKRFYQRYLSMSTPFVV